MRKRTKSHVVAFGSNKSAMFLNAKAIPTDLTNFVEYLTQGNPLFIVETVEQLILQKHIEISQYGRVEVKKNLMEDVKFFEWSHTSMVAGIMCQIEALSPSESAVIKMGCVFDGPFTILDVAASLTASNGKWLDNVKLHKSFKLLVRMGFLTALPIGDTRRFYTSETKLEDEDLNGKFIEKMKQQNLYLLDNFLLRRVCQGMLLRAQAMKIKRQALLRRLLLAYNIKK